MIGENVRQRFAPVAPGAAGSMLFAKAGLPLHAMITGVGYEVRAEPTYDWHGLRRGHAEFVLFQHTLAGRGQLIFEGARHTVEPGQSMLLHFPHDHRYWVAEGDRWEFFWLCLNGSEVVRAWRAAVAGLGPVATLAPATIDAAADACLAILHGEVHSPGHGSSLAYALAMRLLDESRSGPPSPRSLRDPAIGRAITHCRMHLSDEHLGVDALAAAAGYSRWHFSRLFAHSEGMPPGEFILRERMKEAVRLLQETGDPVKAVAARCGFADPNYFAKAFRRVYRVSPREFRDSGMYRLR